MRELPAEDVTRYELLLGREENLRHFMPRLLEADAISATELEDKLQRAHWLHWPQDECDAVKSYLTEDVLTSLENDPPVALQKLWQLAGNFELVRPRLQALLARSFLTPEWFEQLAPELSRPRRSYSQQVLLDWLLENARPRPMLLLPARLSGAGEICTSLAGSVEPSAVTVTDASAEPLARDGA